MFTRVNTVAHGPVNVFPNVATTNYVANNYDTNAIVDLNRTMSPTMVVDLTASFGRFYSVYTWGKSSSRTTVSRVVHARHSTTDLTRTWLQW